MKISRKSIFLCSILLVFLLVGAVSATDLDDSSDDVVALDEDDSNIVLSDANSETTVNSWSDLDGALNGTSGYSTVHIGSSFAPTKQIVINHDVTIEGSSDTYIGAPEGTVTSYSYIPFYTTASGLSITLKNIKFQNCGGNILMQFSGNGNYIVENCTFVNVNATGSHQSVVYLNLGQGNITGCTFENCTTSFGTVTNHNAANVNNVHMIVRNSTFRNNYATTEPGAINNCGHLIVYDTTFENNCAYWWAGAIHTHTNANTTVVRSTFKNNIAGWNGGALYTYSYLRVINSTFIGNNATTNTGGGAIGASSYGSKPYLIVENSVFEDNTALTGNGGAIVFSAGTLIVNDSEFINNGAYLSGGAISASGTVLVDNSEFIKNSARNDGGAISTGATTRTITNSLFINNTATNRGGAIYGSGAGTLTIEYNTFVNNTANLGKEIAYYYTTKKNNGAYLIYKHNKFYGSGNLIYNNTAPYLNTTEFNNTFYGVEEYVPPSDEEENNTDELPTGNVIPDDYIGTVDWDITLGHFLTGTPVIYGNHIFIPAGPILYCYDLDGNYVWNATSTGLNNNFTEVLVYDGAVFAPCAGDKLFILDINNGTNLTNTNIYQGSSLYAPVVSNDGTIYIASEYGYQNDGNINGDLWITVVKKVDGEYVYYTNILNIADVSYGDSALLSKPILDNNGNLYVNTVNGIVCASLSDNGTIVTSTISGTVGNIVKACDGNVYGLAYDGSQTTVVMLNPSSNSTTSMTIDGYCNVLVIDEDGEIAYTVTDNGSIYSIDLTENDVASMDIQVNPVSSSALAVCGDYLYVGDNNGILWQIWWGCPVIGFV